MTGGLVAREVRDSVDWAAPRLPDGLYSTEATSQWPELVVRNPALDCLANSRCVLMLQGPVGPFFDRITRWLKGRGASVHRVTFSGGDEHDCRATVPVRFRDRPDDWPAACTRLLEALRPDCVVLFGQARWYHKVAIEHAKALDIPVVVMEEGYFRPGFATMELGGVNGYSRTLDRYGWDVDPQAKTPQVIQPDLTSLHFQKMAWHAARHYLSIRRLQHTYPNYVHHRNSDPDFYARYWMRSWMRKLRHRGADRKLQQWLFDSRVSYYFVPLQVEGDSQLTHHSPFNGNAEFALKVLRSFAAHAPAESLIVFRQHPHARGGTPLRPFIDSLAASLRVAERVRFLVEGDTPDLAERSRGTVVINSTVGLQAIERGAPLVVLGDAPYKQPHLTFGGSLDEFWTDGRSPDRERAAAFLAQVKTLTQVPASIYASSQDPLLWDYVGG